MEEVSRMKRAVLTRIDLRRKHIKEVFTMKKVVISVLVVAFCVSLTTAAFGQARQVDRTQEQIAYVVFATLPAEERAALMELRHKDAAEFKKVVGQRLKQRWEELQQIKQEDPSRFEQIKQDGINIIKRHIQRSKENTALTQRFQKAQHKAVGRVTLQSHIVFETLPKDQKERLIALRNKYQKALKTALNKRGEELEVLKKSDPDRFKEIVGQAMQRLRERIAKGKRRNPQVFDSLGRVNPGHLKEKLSWLKQEDPELYRYLVSRAVRDKMPR